MQTKTVPPWFTIVVVFALVWNLIGVLAFIGQMMMTPEMVASLSEEEQQRHALTPLWANIAFGVAVISGGLGCVALLMKKLLAVKLFQISLVGVFSQMFHAFFISNTLEVFGPASAVMPALVIVVAVALLWFANKCQRENWLS